MAILIVMEQLKDFDFAGISAERKRKYPWNTWEQGAVWRAEPGADFTCEPESFRRALNDRAAKDGLKVETHIEDDGCVVFRFLLRS